MEHSTKRPILRGGKRLSYHRNNDSHEYVPHEPEVGGEAKVAPWKEAERATGNVERTIETTTFAGVHGKQRVFEKSSVPMSESYWPKTIETCPKGRRDRSGPGKPMGRGRGFVSDDRLKQETKGGVRAEMGF